MSAERSDGEAERRRTGSPCVGVCVIDESTGLCEGCLRTLDEVARWGASSPDERREILQRVARRRSGSPLDAPSSKG